MENQIYCWIGIQCVKLLFHGRNGFSLICSIVWSKQLEVELTVHRVCVNFLRTSGSDCLCMYAGSGKSMWKWRGLVDEQRYDVKIVTGALKSYTVSYIVCIQDPGYLMQKLICHHIVMVHLIKRYLFQFIGGYINCQLCRKKYSMFISI